MVVLVAGAPEVSSQIDRSRPRSSKGREAQSSRVQVREGVQSAVRPRAQDRLGRPEMRRLPGETSAAGHPPGQGEDGDELTMEAIDLSSERQRRERRRAELEARRLRRQQKIRQRLESDPAMFEDDEEMLDLDDDSPRRRGPPTIEPFEGLIEVDAEPVENRPRSTYASRLRELEAERREPLPAPRRRIENRKRDRDLDGDLDDRPDPDRRAARPRSVERTERGRAPPPPTIQRQLDDARNRTFGAAPRRRRGGATTRRPAPHLPPEKVDSRGQVIDDEDPL